VTGSVAYQPCPLGHYGNSTNLRRDTDCTPCPGGYYCDGIGLTYPTDVCDAGNVIELQSLYCIQTFGKSAPKYEMICIKKKFFTFYLVYNETIQIHKCHRF